MIYIAHIPEQLPITHCYTTCSGRNVYTPHRASPLLCFWQTVWSCEVLTRQNQSVQLRLLCIYAHPCFSPCRGFQQELVCKNKYNNGYIKLKTRNSAYKIRKLLFFFWLKYVDKLQRNRKTPSRFSNFSKFFFNFDLTLLQELKMFLQLLSLYTICFKFPSNHVLKLLPEA